MVFSLKDLVKHTYHRVPQSGPSNSSQKTNDKNDWDTFLEAPTRGPLDWRDSPTSLIPNYSNHYVAHEAEYLDAAFQRLYKGSHSFRALLYAKPSLADIKAIIDPFRTKFAQLNPKYNDVSVSKKTRFSDKDGLKAVFMLAHEYRHVWQYQSNYGVFGDLIVTPQEFRKLYHATEADAYMFHTICALEVLMTEGSSFRSACKKLKQKNSLPTCIPQASFSETADRPYELHNQSASMYGGYFASDSRTFYKYEAKIKDIIGRILKPIEDEGVNTSDTPVKISFNFASLNNSDGTISVFTDEEAEAESSNFVSQLENMTVLHSVSMAGQMETTPYTAFSTQKWHPVLI